MVRALLYGAALPAEYWSSALIHAVYLHNRRFSKATNKTPYEGKWGSLPNFKGLRLFGSRVCVKRSGDCRSKLDKHDFTGIYLIMTVTDDNIRYVDVNSGEVKSSHNATFDEAWYLQ